MRKRTAQLIVVLCLAFPAAAPAEGSGARAGGCGASSFSHAGLQSRTKANGVAATLTVISAPSVLDGHVGGWVLQVVPVVFNLAPKTEMYYEVNVARTPRLQVRHARRRRAAGRHASRVAARDARPQGMVARLGRRSAGEPADSPAGKPLRLVPAGVGENYAGGSGACNGYSFRFTDVALAGAQGGDWQPLEGTSLFHDRGVPTSAVPRSFVATGL